jgi:hypothetical protein
LEDLQFVLIVFLSQDSEEKKNENVQDYLVHRYERPLVSSVMLSLRYAYNWIVKNWVYLEEVGLRKENGIVNCVLFALHNLIFKEVSEENWKSVPSTDPRIVVKMSQEFIDAENERREPE